MLISNAALAGSCPMLWGKIDSSINNIADEELKAKIQELRDAGMKAHDSGEHKKSVDLLNKALEMFKG